MSACALLSAVSLTQPQLLFKVNALLVQLFCTLAHTLRVRFMAEVLLVMYVGSGVVQHRWVSLVYTVQDRALILL